MTWDITPVRRASGLYVAYVIAAGGEVLYVSPERHCLRCALDDAAQWAFWKLEANGHARAWREFPA